jgi:nucleoside-diphosphate-sugar epimerase
VGSDTFGVFLHLGLGNEMPFTFVENCADAIVLAGLTPGVEGQVFIVVDDDRPTSREYLRRYKQRVGRFRTIPVPYRVYYLLNFLLERYSMWSEGQLPLTFNRRNCMIYYKGNTYSNAKAKRLLGWSPKVTMDEALDRCFDSIVSTKVSM